MTAVLARWPWAVPGGGACRGIPGDAQVTRQSGKTLDSESRSLLSNHRLKNTMFLAAFASLSDPGVQGLLRPQAR